MSFCVSVSADMTKRVVSLYVIRFECAWWIWGACICVHVFVRCVERFFVHITYPSAYQNGRKRPITQRPSHGFNDINDDDEYPEDYEEYNEELTVLRMSEEQYDETDDDDDETDDVELGSADDDNSDDDTDDDADDDDSNVSPMYEDVDEQKSSRWVQKIYKCGSNWSPIPRTEHALHRKARSLTDDLTFGSIVETPPPHDILHHLIPYQELSDTEYPHSNRYVSFVVVIINY